MSDNKFADWAARVREQAQAFNWDGFVKEMSERERTYHAYLVIKPSDRDWPSGEVLACWCDDYNTNFGCATGFNGDLGHVKVYVD